MRIAAGNFAKQQRAEAEKQDDAPEESGKAMRWDGSLRCKCCATPFRGVSAVHFALCLHGFLRLRFAFKSILKLGAGEG